MRIETKAIHSGLDVENNTKDIVPPVHRTTVFELKAEGYEEGDLNYTRHANPNRLQLEKLLAELEEGEACAAFSSGVAAASAVFQALSPGDHILMPDDVYSGNRLLVKSLMQSWGLQADFIDMTEAGNIEAGLRENTRLIWIESPSNPMLNITDIQATCALARGKNIVVCVDNTWPTPVNQLPLKLGADLSLHSTTKYLGGHSDILGGAVIARQREGIFERIAEIQTMAGAVPSPQDCWLLTRSIRTLPYRMRGHNSNGALVAEFLQEHSRVEKVFFPGLESHPGHDIAREQMHGFGGMISFLVDGSAKETIQVVASSGLIKRATSLGGVESTWEHRLSSEGADSTTPENLIRISVGLEHPDDLMEDLQKALS